MFRYLPRASMAWPQLAAVGRAPGIFHPSQCCSCPQRGFGVFRLPSPHAFGRLTTPIIFIGGLAADRMRKVTIYSGKFRRIMPHLSRREAKAGCVSSAEPMGDTVVRSVPIGSWSCRKRPRDRDGPWAAAASQAPIGLADERRLTDRPRALRIARRSAVRSPNPLHGIFSPQHLGSAPWSARAYAARGLRSSHQPRRPPRPWSRRPVTVVAVATGFWRCGQSVPDPGSRSSIRP